MPTPATAAAPPSTPALTAAAIAVPRDTRLAMQDGRELFISEYGPYHDSCAPLLCLPGLTRNHRDFTTLAERLAHSRRVVLADMRGRGGADRDPDPRNYAPARALADVLHVLSACRLHGCVILGTSYGGFLAMGVAVAQPRALKGVILNDVGPEVAESESEFILRYVKAMKPQPDWEAAARYARDLVGADWDKDDATWLRIARQSYVEAADGTLRLDYDPKIAWPFESRRDPRDAPDLWALFGALRNVPTLVIRGALSRVLNAGTLDRMSVAHPNLEHVTVTGVGHAPLLDEPEATAAIDRFLEAF